MTSDNFGPDNLELTNFGYGKIILFGEHFVVHGLPAVAAALDLKTHTQITANDFEKSSCNNLVLIDDRPKAPGFVPSKSAQYKLVCENILNFFQNFCHPVASAVALREGWELDSGLSAIATSNDGRRLESMDYYHLKQRNFTVTFSGNLPVTCGGIGSSAAFAVSFVRAVNTKFNLGLSDELINQAAYLVEQAVHGTPSGIDNTTAVFGGVIKFCMQKSVSEFTPAFLYSKFKILKPIEIVIIDSGKQTDTKNAIAVVSEFIQKNRAQSDKIFEQYKDIFNLGINALENSNLEKLGMCMNKNHRLLQELGVSCPELDEIIHKAQSLGALGAKLTGTGLGGLVVALTPGVELQDRVANYFERDGYFVMKSKISS